MVKKILKGSVVMGLILLIFFNFINCNKDFYNDGKINNTLVIGSSFKRLKDNINPQKENNEKANEDLLGEKQQQETNRVDEEQLAIKTLLEKEKEDLAILVNKNNPLDENYKPTDLVVPNVKLTCSRDSERSHLRKEAADALEEMFKAAQKENIELYLCSGFRSSEYQASLFNQSLMNKGKTHTDKYVAKPNHSEHQSGLGVDITASTVNYSLEQYFENTKEGKWLADNSYKYGFILRYTKDRESDTGYAFEPWHFRYVGKDLSSYIYKNNLILEDLY
ncbi:MAG: M15 family metallopeptidase [Sarcina sp.]